MEPLSIKCCESVFSYLFILFFFFFFFTMLLFLSVVLFGIRRERHITHCIFSAWSICKEEWMEFRLKIQHHMEAVPTWESGRRALLKEKAELAKQTHTGEKQLIIFFSPSLSHTLFLFASHSPGSHGSVCLSTWLTAALWAVGELSVHQARCPLSR